jgi:hypothetical protein
MMLWAIWQLIYISFLGATNCVSLFPIIGKAWELSMGLWSRAHKTHSAVVCKTVAVLYHLLDTELVYITPQCDLQVIAKRSLYRLTYTAPLVNASVCMIPVLSRNPQRPKCHILHQHGAIGSTVNWQARKFTVIIVSHSAIVMVQKWTEADWKHRNRLRVINWRCAKY